MFKHPSDITSSRLSFFITGVVCAFCFCIVYSSCLKTNPFTNNKNIDSLNQVAIFQNLENINFQVWIVSGGKDLDSIKMKSNINLVTLSNGEPVMMTFTFNADSTLVTVKLNGKNAVEKKINILVLKNTTPIVKSVSLDTIIAIYNSLPNNYSGISSNTITLIAIYSPEDLLERNKDAVLINYWYLQNTSQSYTINEVYLNKLEDLAKKLAEKYDPDFKPKLLNAGSFDAYFYGINPNNGTQAYMEVSPIQAFAQICDGSTPFYKGKTLEEKMGIALCMKEWMVENDWVVP